VDHSLASLHGKKLAVYTIRFAATSAGQRLTVRWTQERSYGAGASIILEAAEVE